MHLQLMNESFGERGIWYLGALPNHELQGSLDWGPTTGAKLVLRVLDQDVYEYLSKSLGSECSVHGRLRTRPCVSLAGATIVGISGNPWDAEVEIHAVRLLKGPAPMESWDGIGVTDLSVKFTGLNQWIDDTVIKVNQDARFFRVESDRRVESLFYEDNDFRLFISRSCATSHSKFRFTIDSVAKFEVRPKKPMPFKSVKEFVEEIRAYLTIAMDAPVVAESLSVIFSDPALEDDPTGIPQIYDFYEQSDKAAFESTRKGYDEHRMLFMFSPGDDSSAAFSKFLSLYRRYPAILDFYLSQTYGRESYLYQQFCDMTFGLEGLHRALHGGYYMDKNDFKLKVLCLIKHSIPGWVSGSLRSVINSRLDGANSYSLRDRLMNLASRHEACAGPYLGDGERFAKLATDLRNDIAHAKSGLRKDAAGQERIIALLFRARLLFQLELLVQLGFDEQYIKRRLPYLRSSYVCRRYQV